MPTNRTITEADGSIGPEVEYEPKSSYSVKHTLSVLFRLMGSDCPFGILKLFLLSVVMLILSSYKSMQDNVLQQHTRDTASI
jgi:hypothetical protein